MPSSQMQATAPDGGPFATFQSVPFGVAQYLPVQLQSLLFLPFSFSCAWVPINSGVSAVVQQFTVGNDSHFVLTNLTGTVYGTATNPPVFFPEPGLTLLITDTGSGYQLQDAAQPWNNLVGSMAGAGQFLYTVPYLVEANSTVNVSLSNLDTTDNLNVRLSINGFKVYGVPRDNPEIAIPPA